MNWIDNKAESMQEFKKIKIGECFEDNEQILFIKVDCDGAFDVCNNSLVAFPKDEKVYPRNAEIIFR